MKTHTYAEWEEEFRDKIKAAGIPLNEDQSDGTTGTDRAKNRRAATGATRRSSSARACTITARQPKHVTSLGMANPRQWQPTDADWKLPPDWKQIVLDGMKDRLKKYRSFRLFMDICVRCGACADKCHFYLGSGDPKNMPVMRAELLRSVYRALLHRAADASSAPAGN